MRLRLEHWIVVAMATVCAVLAVAAIISVRHRQPYVAPAPVPGPSLQVQLRDSGALVTWDRQSAAVRAANSAVLRIQDGDSTREVKLSKSDLLAGWLWYRPSSAELTFELAVDGALHRTEVVSALNGRQRAAHEPIPAAIPDTPRIDVPPKRPVVSEVRPAERRTRPGPQTRTEANTRNVVPRLSLRLPEADRIRPLPIPDTPANPAVPPPSTAPDSSSTLPNRVAQSTVPPQIPVEPPAHPVQDTAPRVNAAPTLEPTTVPPQPIRRVSPTLNASLASMVYSPVVVDIEASVDARGKVSKVRFLRATPMTNQLLVVQAMDAAARWTFQPATRGGAPVASTHTISFRFEPPK